MNTGHTTQASLVRGLLQTYSQPSVSETDALRGLRAQAAERAQALGLPGARDEEWRFTDVSALSKLDFKPAAEQSPVTLADIRHFILQEAHTSRLVFVDGIYAPSLSALHELPRGVLATSLAQAPAHPLLQAQLARQVDWRKGVFAALNTSLFRDAALLVIPQDAEISVPLHLLFIARPHHAAHAVHPRCLVLAEAHSQCTLIEDYAALGEGVYFNNAASEIRVREGAQLRHIRVQRDSRAAFHIADSAVSVARDAQYHASSITLGARLSRYNPVINLEQGAECSLDGLTMIAGRQLADTHSVIEHTAPHTKSRQAHKCIVDEGAHAVFNGKVIVHKDAQLTDAAQESRMLLLSDKARVNVKPELQILADDVKCTHGATVGQLEDEELFYLKSRGIGEAEARNLLIYAFAAELIERIPVDTLKASLREAVLRRAHLEQPA